MRFYFVFLSLTLATVAMAQISPPPTAGNYFTSFDSAKIYYEISGRGRAVVMVHGFVVDGASWKRTAVYADLIKAGFMVITVDLRGNGKSDKPHQPEAYEHDAEAKDIMGIVTKLKIRRYDVVGYSRGSIIASRLMVLDPRVRRCVMGGMGADFTNPEWPRRIMFYEGLMGKPVPEVEGLIKHIQATGLDQLALAYLQKAQPNTSKEELSKIKKPVLVVCGTEDIDNGSSKALAALLPKSEYATVPGDHGAAVRTTEFANAVISFLKQ